MNTKSYTHGKARPPLIPVLKQAREIKKLEYVLPQKYVIQFFNSSGELMRVSANEAQAVYKRFTRILQRGACTKVEVFMRRIDKLVKIDTAAFFKICKEL